MNATYKHNQYITLLQHSIIYCKDTAADVKLSVY